MVTRRNLILVLFIIAMLSLIFGCTCSINKFDVEGNVEDVIDEERSTDISADVSFPLASSHKFRQKPIYFLGKMDKKIQKVKKMNDVAMDNLVRLDKKRDKKVEKCDKEMHKKK